MQPPTFFSQLAQTLHQSNGSGSFPSPRGVGVIGHFDEFSVGAVLSAVDDLRKFSLHTLPWAALRHPEAQSFFHCAAVGMFFSVAWAISQSAIFVAS
jgi:hypothetical protein